MVASGDAAWRATSWRRRPQDPERRGGAARPEWTNRDGSTPRRCPHPAGRASWPGASGIRRRAPRWLAPGPRRRLAARGRGQAPFRKRRRRSRRDVVRACSAVRDTDRFPSRGQLNAAAAQEAPRDHQRQRGVELDRSRAGHHHLGVARHLGQCSEQPRLPGPGAPPHQHDGTDRPSKLGDRAAEHRQLRVALYETRSGRVPNAHAIEDVPRDHPRQDSAHSGRSDGLPIPTQWSAASQPGRA